MADLSEAVQRQAFLSQVESAAADATCDPVVCALAAEIQVVLERIETGDMTADGATELVSQLLTAAAQAVDRESKPQADTATEVNVYAEDQAIVADFIVGAGEQLDEADRLLSAAAIGETVDVAALFRCMHTLKGMSGFLGLDDLAGDSHAAEAILETVRSGARQMGGSEIESMLAIVDRARGRVAGLDASAKPKTAGAAAPGRRAQHVRVDAARLEGLLDAMGELAVAESELAEAVRKSQDPDAIRSLERLQRIARDMHSTATMLRMVTLKQTFAKMTRVVRDALALSDKSAELHVSGEDTEIDRTIVEGLGDPLVHLLRNAVDHGIEPAEERVAAGKPSVGRLSLRAFHRSGSVFIEIEDDGRGIDPERLTRRAEQLGVEFDRERPLSLIFHPGFSTAEEVTELSGRGVGMDAVAEAVAALRGQLEVTSEPGSGCLFTIRLPLTLAVIDGIVVRAGSERFVVPTHFVVRTAAVAPGDVVSVAGLGEALVLEEGPVPAVSTARLLAAPLDTGSVAVLLADGDERFALLVDEVIGQQSLVIKPLTGPAAEAAGPAGAALMGDGSVALVVDPTGLSRAMRRGW